MDGGVWRVFWGLWGVPRLPREMVGFGGVGKVCVGGSGSMEAAEG